MALDILIVLPTAVLGGAERVMRNLAEHLADEGHRVTVYVMSRGLQPGWEDLLARSNFRMIVRRFGSEKVSLPATVWRIHRLTRERPVNYVISTHTHVNALLSLLRKTRLLRCDKLIGRESTFIFERFFGIKRLVFFYLYRFWYGSHDLLICQTENMKESLLAHLGFSPARRVAVMKNPVNLADLGRRKSAGQVDTARAAGTVLVACGRLVKLKGHYALIEAFSSIISRCPSAILYIIGDGPERLNLTRLIESHNLCGKVVLLGHLENPIPWFQAANIGIVSSVREGFPNVLLEMMASGTQNIICTPCTDGIHLIPKVMVTADCSSQALADAMLAAISAPIDNASIYMDYIARRCDVSAFWVEARQVA